MNRKRMADWQEEYQVSLNDLDVNVSENGGNHEGWRLGGTFYLLPRNRSKCCRCHNYA